LKHLPEEIFQLKESNDHFEQMRKDMAQIKKENNQLKTENQALSQQVKLLEDKINDLDQYHKKQNLEIHNIPIKAQENLHQLAMGVLSCIDNIIKESDFREKNEFGEVKSTRPTIVRFKNRKTRNQIFAKRSGIYKFSTSGEKKYTYINENLTPRNQQLLAKANKKRKEKQWKYLWTNNGRISMKKDDRAHAIVINDESELHKIN